MRSAPTPIRQRSSARSSLSPVRLSHLHLGGRSEPGGEHGAFGPIRVPALDTRPRGLCPLHGNLSFAPFTSSRKRMIQVCQLFISPGHNYFGHHGQPAGENPMIEVAQIDCVAGRGIRGDRFFDFKENYKGQITFFSLEVLEALRRELNLSQAGPSATRRNALVSGGDLNSLIGREFEIQGVRFAGVESCQPCHWMNSALGPGAEGWLQGRGGLRARILIDGVLQHEV
jgi:hypothetical protein